jgi:SAM-dependent methyltransferase
MCASLINDTERAYSLLDVGCRGKELKAHLSGCVRYQGIDLRSGDEVVAHDLEAPIPFPDKSFDVVVALDVVEHVDRAQQLVRETLRVARRRVFISLPNMAYYELRLKYLFGRSMSGKYAFPPDSLRDRHRWLPMYWNSREFVLGIARDFDVSVYPVPRNHSRMVFLNVLERRLASFWPNLFAFGSLFEIVPPKSPHLPRTAPDTPLSTRSQY